MPWSTEPRIKREWKGLWCFRTVQLAPLYTCMHDSCVYIVWLIVYGVTTYPAPEQGSGLLGQEQGEALGTGKPLWLYTWIVHLQPLPVYTVRALITDQQSTMNHVVPSGNSYRTYMTTHDSFECILFSATTLTIYQKSPNDQWLKYCAYIRSDPLPYNGPYQSQKTS